MADNLKISLKIFWVQTLNLTQSKIIHSFLPHSDLWEKPVGWAEEWLYILTSPPTQPPPHPPTQPPDRMDCKTFKALQTLRAY